MTEIAFHPSDEIVKPGRINERGAARSLSSHCAVTRRGVQVALGVLWLLDGALQLQSFMFTPGFAHQVVAPSALGQPGWVAWPVVHAANFIGTHAVAVDVAFAGTQLMLGAGFLFRRTVRPAVVVSVVWALGVWFIGEGLGGVAGGTASLLTGAPGAALLYSVLALAAWPVPITDLSGSGGVSPWFIRAWAALWFGFGILALLPANRSTASVVGQLRSPAGRVPGWLGSVDAVAAQLANDLWGVAVALLVILPMGIGLLMLGSDRQRRFAAWSGIVVAVVVWAVGQSFGFVASGTATDPNTGPLLVVGGLALLGAVSMDRRSSVRANESE